MDKEINIIDKIKLQKSIKGELIIDCHAHYGLTYPMYVPYWSEKQFIDYVNLIGIEYICISHFLSVGPDFKAGNDEVFRLMKRYPHKIIGQAVINPNYPSEVRIELERCFNNGFRIFKLHPMFHEYRADGKNYKPVYEFCDDNKLIILSHSFESPDFLEKMAKKYKNIIYIIGHGNDKGYEEVLKNFKNVFMSIVCSNEFGEIERLVREVGSDKLLFGTDTPYLDAGFQLGSIIYADISDMDKRKILGKNMFKILKGIKLI